MTSSNSDDAIARLILLPRSKDKPASALIVREFPLVAGKGTLLRFRRSVAQTRRMTLTEREGKRNNMNQVHTSLEMHG
jgi:hypothetical protein